MPSSRNAPRITRRSHTTSKTEARGPVRDRYVKVRSSRRYARMIPMSAPAPVPLRVDRVSVNRGGVVALRGVTVAFLPGSATALVGPNGSGKTTLLEVLAGLQPVDRGTVVGRPTLVSLVSHGARRPWLPLTVREVIRMARFAPGLIPRRLAARDHDAVARAASRLEVEALLGLQMEALSAGQRQRVMVAQALAREAPLILLDEPVTGLDLGSQERILQIVAEESSAGRTVILSTHHLDEARHCDRVILLAGRVVAQGTPDEVLCPECLREAYGDRVLGDHHEHDHSHDLILIDDHGHGGH